MMRFDKETGRYEELHPYLPYENSYSLPIDS
jgi:hypothetical protein